MHSRNILETLGLPTWYVCGSHLADGRTPRGESLRCLASPHSTGVPIFHGENKENRAISEAEGPDARCSEMLPTFAN